MKSKTWYSKNAKQPGERVLPGRTVPSGYKRAMAMASVGPGWAHLVGAVFDVVDTYPADIRVTQVKEKFATLRIYFWIDTADNTRGLLVQQVMEKIVREAETLSATLCEDCGRPGTIDHSASWQRCLCGECREDSIRRKQEDPAEFPSSAQGQGTI